MANHKNEREIMTNYISIKKKLNIIKKSVQHINMKMNKQRRWMTRLTKKKKKKEER